MYGGTFHRTPLPDCSCDITPDTQGANYLHGASDRGPLRQGASAPRIWERCVDSLHRLYDLCREIRVLFLHSRRNANRHRLLLSESERTADNVMPAPAAWHSKRQDSLSDAVYYVPYAKQEYGYDWRSNTLVERRLNPEGCLVSWIDVGDYRYEPDPAIPRETLPFGGLAWLHCSTQGV